MTFLRGDVAERLHRPVQASEGFPDRNQPAALTLHGFSFSHDGRSALKRCSLGLDLYLWTAYRTFALKHPQRFSWQQVYRQFGAHPDNASDKRTVLNFRSKVLRELKKIKLAWPDLNYGTAKGVLILSPSTPAIAPLSQGQLGR